MGHTIAIVGTHCTRKTTSVNHLAAAAMAIGQSIVIVPEVARTSPLAINEDTTTRAQLWIATTQIAREIEAAANAPVILTDGALVNDYAYLLRANDASPDTPPAVDPFGLQRLVEDWTANTEAFLFLRPDIPTIADGVRSVDEAFRRDIDTRLAELLARYADRSAVIEMAASGVTPESDWIELLARLGATNRP